MGDCSDSDSNKFGGVSAEDSAKLIAYYDTLSYSEKLDGVYSCDLGQLQIGHNADASELTITWLVNEAFERTWDSRPMLFQKRRCSL